MDLGCACVTALGALIVMLAKGKNREAKTITIRPDDKTVLQGDGMPALTYSISGKAAWDSLVAEPKLTCAARDTSTPGIYNIEVAGAAVDNAGYYEGIVYGTGVLSIRRMVKRTRRT